MNECVLFGSEYDQLTIIVTDLEKDTFTIVAVDMALVLWDVRSEYVFHEDLK